MTSPVGSSVPGDTPISDEQRALQEQLDRPNFEGHKKRECGEHRTVGPRRAWCYDCTEWCYPRPEMACKGCMVPTLLVEVERLTQELDRANTAHARALVRYSQDPLLQRIIDTEAERDAAEDVLRWLVSLDAPGSAARASVTLPDIIARAKVVLRVQDELGACGKPAPGSGPLARCHRTDGHEGPHKTFRGGWPPQGQAFGWVEGATA